MHIFTLYGSVRPFGCSVMFGAYGADGPQLFLADPSGVSWVSQFVSSLVCLLALELSRTPISSLSLCACAGVSWLCCRQGQAGCQDGNREVENAGHDLHRDRQRSGKNVRQQNSQVSKSPPRVIVDAVC